MKLLTTLFALLMSMIVLTGCGAIETIFKAGMIWAFVLIALVIIVVIWIVNKARK